MTEDHTEHPLFAEKLENTGRRNLLKLASATAAGTALSSLPGNAQADANDSAIELFLRALISGYESTRPLSLENQPKKPSPPQKPASLFTTDYASIELITIDMPRFSSEAAQKSFDTIVQGFMHAPGNRKKDSIATGIKLFAEGKSPHTIPKGLRELESGTTLSPQEKAQVFGVLLLLFRAGDTSRQTATGTARPQDGMQAIIRLAKICPEITRIQYSWLQPKPEKLDKDGKPQERKELDFNKVTGHLGDFLVSDVQFINPHHAPDTRIGYMLYDYKRGFDAAMVGVIEKQAAAKTTAETMKLR